jgi:hypothetical protein
LTLYPIGAAVAIAQGKASSENMAMRTILLIRADNNLIDLDDGRIMLAEKIAITKPYRVLVTLKYSLLFRYNNPINRPVLHQVSGYLTKRPNHRDQLRKFSE